MVQTASTFLYASFFLFLAATIFFAVSITGKNFKSKKESKGDKLGVIGYITALLGTLSALLYFIFRWIGIGHAPVSNMFEYTTFLGISMAVAFTIIYPLYKSNYLGLFTMPIIMLIIAYASVFPTEVQPLIPALKSDWLEIHVITVALGQGILAISFAAGLLYLIRVIDFKKPSKQRATIEFIMFSLLSVLAYIILSIGFNGVEYEALFSYVNKDGKTAEMVYHMPTLIGPNEGELLTEEKLSPILSAPALIKSNDLNTVIWSLIGGVLLYFLIRVVIRKPIGAAIQPFLKFVDPDTVDEISYRAIAIGFPVFTLGGLIFAMIWAQIAWTRFWGWDPKEVWALVTFLFYAAYLHLRLSRGWHGEKSAWLCVIGFVIIIFNLIFVNLVIAGLHAYV